MQIKTFTVPFSEIVPAEAFELEFSENDQIVVRPIFGQPVSEIRDLQERLAKMTEITSEAEAYEMVLEIMARSIIRWHLDGPDGPIDKPTTPEELNALPGALRGALFPFLISFRGRGPNPTPGA